MGIAGLFGGFLIPLLLTAFIRRKRVRRSVSGPRSSTGGS
jgi:hypothetical protein